MDPILDSFLFHYTNSEEHTVEFLKTACFLQAVSDFFQCLWAILEYIAYHWACYGGSQ